MALIILRTLTSMGYPQVVTPLKTNNDTANKFAHLSMRVKHSKTWDMRYHCLQVKLEKTICKLFWDRGKHILTDYFTKHDQPSHYCIQQYKYIFKDFNLSQLDNSLNTLTFSARVSSFIMKKLLT